MGWLIVLAYVYAVVDNISGVFQFTMIASALLVALVLVIKIASAMVIADTYRELQDDAKKNLETAWEPFTDRVLKYAPKSFVITAILWAIIPSSDGMKYIAGAAIVAYSAEAVSSINGIDQMPEKMVTIVNGLLDDIAEDIKEKDPKPESEDK